MTYFYYIFSIIGKKHLVIEWLSWLPYKSGFNNSSILETSKERPNTPPSLKFLEQRVHTLVVEGQGSIDRTPSPPPPPPLDNVVGTKGLDQEGLLSLTNDTVIVTGFFVRLLFIVKVTYVQLHLSPSELTEAFLR